MAICSKLFHKCGTGTVVPGQTRKTMNEALLANLSTQDIYRSLLLGGLVAGGGFEPRPCTENT